MPYRLGDDVDDYCIKCKRVTNHSIVSLLNEDPAKVRCRTCYNDHDYRHEIAPPSKKELKKAQLFQEVLSKVDPAAEEGAAESAAEGEAAIPAIVDPPAEAEAEVAAPALAPAKKGKRK